MSDELEDGAEEAGYDQLDDFFVEGDASDDGSAADEVADEPGDDVVDDSANEVDEDAAEDAGEDAADPPAPVSDKPDTSAMMDKELQKVQQLRATLERDVAAAQANPTPETIKKAEATKSRLDVIIESQDDEYGVDAVKAAVTLAQEGKVHEAKLAELQKAVESTAGMSSQQVAAMQGQMARLQFKLDHPNLADRYDELAKAAAAEVDGMLGEAAPHADPRVLARLDNAAFMRLIAAEESKSQAENEQATDAPPPRKKPVATSPIKNKSGKSSKPEETDEQRTERLLAGLTG